MSMQVNPNAGSVNWESLLQQVGNLTKSSAPGEKPVLTFTSTAADGSQCEIKVSMPDDLDLPATVDQAAIDSLCAKLAADPKLGVTDKQIEELHDALTAVLKSTSIPDSINALATSKNVMFDLYKLMALLVEVAQKQRDAARDLRTATSQQIQTSIQNQADKQRNAAMWSIAGSIICCAIQAGAMAFSLYKQASAFKTQLASLETSGVGSARENLTMLQAGESAQGAQQQLASARAHIDDAAAQRIQNSFDNAAISKGQMQAREIHMGEAATKLQRIQNVNAPLQEADIPQGAHGDALRTANTRMNEFQEMQQLRNGPQPLNEQPAARLATLEAKFQNVTEQQLTNDLNTARQNVVTDLQQTVQNDQTQATALKAQANSRLDSALKTYEDAYKTAVRQRAEVAPNATKAEIKALDQRLETTGNELKYARAYAINERLDVTTAAERQRLSVNAESRLTEAQALMKGDTSYIKAGQIIQRYEGINSLINAGGICMQNIVQSINTIKQADASEEGAVQERKKEELEQVKDLFAQAGDLVQAVVQLMQAISSAETQSMRDAIQV